MFICLCHVLLTLNSLQLTCTLLCTFNTCTSGQSKTTLAIWLCTIVKNKAKNRREFKKQ